MGEQIKTNDHERELSNSEIDPLPPDHSLSPKFLGSVRMVLLLLGLCAIFIGFVISDSVDTSMPAGESSASSYPGPPTKNFVAQNPSISEQKGTSGLPDESDTLRWKLGSSAINLYRSAQGLNEPTRGDLDAIAAEICSDLRAGGDGKFYHPDLVPSNETLIEWSIAVNYAYATSAECDLSSDYPAGNRIREAMLDVAENGDNSLGSDDANLVAPSFSPPSSIFNDGTVICNDGTISNAGGSQGACSWHGGIQE